MLAKTRRLSVVSEISCLYKMKCRRKVHRGTLLRSRIASLALCLTIPRQVDQRHGSSSFNQCSQLVCGVEAVTSELEAKKYASLNCSNPSSMVQSFRIQEQFPKLVI